MKYYKMNEPLPALLAYLKRLEDNFKSFTIQNNSSDDFSDGLKEEISKTTNAIQNEVESLKLKVQQSITMKEEVKNLNTIGFFGGQKRGKSSLINLFLGCNIMPVAANVMSSITITAQHDKDMEENTFKVDIVFEDTSHQSQIINLEKTQKLLKQFGSRKGESHKPVSEIIVTSNFAKSTILKEGGKLVDTPGAEYAFTDNVGEVINSAAKSKTRDEAIPEFLRFNYRSNNSSEDKNLNEVKKALDTLKKTQIVVFCERTDYLQNKSGVEFYHKELEKLNPIIVLNFMDKFMEAHDKEKDNSEDVEESKKLMRDKMVEIFNVKYEDIKCVSSNNDVYKAKIENDNNNLLDIYGINELEDAIKNKIGNLEPEKVIEDSLNTLKDMHIRVNKKLDEIVSEVGDSLNPNIVKIRSLINNKVYLNNFKYAMENSDFKEDFKIYVKKQLE